MRFTVARAAQNELNDTARWYEERRPGLGAEFLAEYARCVGLISRRPRTFARESDAPSGHDVRSLLLDRFPYRLAYRVSDDSIVLVAVAHGARRPGYWSDRLEEE